MVEESENYKVLAIKYRPKTFSEIIGQDVLVKTLTNAINSKKIHHAFILNGIRGVGKTTTARIIAKSLNCIGEDGNGVETSNPCLKCVHCKAITNSSDQDVIEFDAASHTGVNDIRDIIDSINYAPISSRYKIYIIDEVHMLSNSAFNALLKTLEEPPAHVKFIFATTEIRKVPITILSRCIRFDLSRVSQEILTNNLIDIAFKEGYVLSDSAAKILAHSAEGSVRDSLSLLDRVISFNNFSKNIDEKIITDLLYIGDKEKICDIYSSILDTNISDALEKFDNIYQSIINIDNFLNDMLEITHKLLMKKSGNSLESLSTFQTEWFNNNIDKVKVSGLLRIWQFIIKALSEIKIITDSKSFIEVLLIKMCYGINIPEINDLIKKLQNNSISIKSTKNNDMATEVLNTFNGSKIVN